MGFLDSNRWKRKETSVLITNLIRKNCLTKRPELPIVFWLQLKTATEIYLISNIRKFLTLILASTIIFSANIRSLAEKHQNNVLVGNLNQFK